MGRRYNFNQVCWIFFRLSLLFQLVLYNYRVNAISAETIESPVAMGLSGELTKIDGKPTVSSSNDDRITKLEAKSRHQEIEIASLKTGADQDRKTINQLNGRVIQLELQVANLEANSKILHRSKRLYPQNLGKRRMR